MSDEQVTPAVRCAAGLDAGQASELAAELDPARVRTKDGRGGGGLSYLAVHNVIRTANRIFGFGGWGYVVRELAHIDSIPVKQEGRGNKPARQGIHVGYRCTVELTVAGCLPVSGVGYGDGVEYTGSGAVTAHELAAKEAESDALKRAFRNYGDQFGLILYAKDDERRRIEQERNRPDPARDAIVRATSWPEVTEWFEKVTHEPLAPWVLAIVKAKFGKDSTADLTAEQRTKELFIGVAEAYVDLALHELAGGVPPIPREDIAAAFVARFEGLDFPIPDLETRDLPEHDHEAASE